MTIVSYSRSVW